jgi:hypothetical protein
MEEPVPRKRDPNKPKQKQNRLSPERWLQARARYETDPTVTLGALAVEIGVSHTAVQAQAKRHQWQKQSALEVLRTRAHREADNHIQGEELPKDFQEEINRLENMGTAKEQKRAADVQLAYDGADSVAVALRAKILNRHRREWGLVRRLLYLAARKKDKESALTAKYAGEGFKLLQEGERKAWGIEVGGIGEGQQVHVHIGREPSPDDQ